MTGSELLATDTQTLTPVVPSKYLVNESRGLRVGVKLLGNPLKTALLKTVNKVS